MEGRGEMRQAGAGDKRVQWCGRAGWLLGSERGNAHLLRDNQRTRSPRGEKYRYIYTGIAIVSLKHFMAVFAPAQAQPR